MLHHGSIAYCRIAAPGASGSYLFLGGWLVCLWLIYPICWGLTDGGKYLSVTSSFIWFGIEDCLVQPGTALVVGQCFSPNLAEGFREEIPSAS